MSDDTFYIDVNRFISFDKTLDIKANTIATVKAIIKTINTFANSEYIKEVVRILNQGNPSDLEFIKRLFDIVCINVDYRRDPQGHEIVFTPLLLMKIGKGDCKKMTTFICAVLKQKGIACATKVVSYDGKDWEHIYAQVPIIGGKFITLDPVNHCKYNSEVKFTKGENIYLDSSNQDIMTKLSLMGNLPSNYQDYLNAHGAASNVMGDLEAITGVGDTASRFDDNALSGLCDIYMNGLGDDEGMGAVKKKTPAQKQVKKEQRKKFVSKVKKVGAAPVRVAFLALIIAGKEISKTPLKINLATKLATLWQKDNGATITLLWEKFGGKREALRAALAKAANTTLKGINDNSTEMELSGIGVVTATAITTTIATAAPILLPIIKALKDKGIVSPEESGIIENSVNNAEQKSQTDGGELKPAAAQELVTSPIVKEASKIDDGGNKATQADMIKQQDEKSKNDGSSSDQQKADQNNLPSNPTSDQSSASDNNPNNLPAPKDMYASNKSMSGAIHLPTTWFKTFFLLLVFAHYLPPVLMNVLSTITVVGIIITTIYLFTNKKNHDGKI